jgi:dynactin-4
MTFEKPTGLASESSCLSQSCVSDDYILRGLFLIWSDTTFLPVQLQKTEDERPDVKEFEHLREHFEKHLRTSAPSTSLPAQLYSLSGLTFSNRFHGGNLSHSQSKSDDVAPYEPVVKAKDEFDSMTDFGALKDVNESKY